jgi:uncharacterized membrane protein
VKKPEQAASALTVLNVLLRIVISGTGVVLMWMGARVGLPLISLIGAVLILIWFHIWTREDDT